MTKNDLISLEITGLSNDGSGVGRHEGMAVFVPFTAPGDVAEVRIVKVTKSYAFGILAKLLTPSPARVAADCEAFGRCGGCALRHLSYETELLAKRGFVQDAFSKLGGFAVEAAPCLPSPEEDRYRNKVQYPLVAEPDGTVRYGFFASRSHRVIPCADCKLQPAELNLIADALCALFTEYGITVYDEASRKGVLRHLYLRRGAHSGEVMVCIVVNANRLKQEAELVAQLTAKFPSIKTILINSNRENTNVILGRRSRTIFGDGYITDTLCGVPVKLGPASFYQVNTLAAEQLYGTAKALAALRPGEVLLDLYCGTGTIGLSMADGIGELIGVEIVPEAVESARRNAAEMGIANARFFCEDAGAAAAHLAEEGLRPDVIVLDPPRKGCDAPTLDAVLKMAPQRIVMVSCNAATAARDCQKLCAEGYVLHQISPVDLFPRTRHCEVVCLLQRYVMNEYIIKEDV